MNSSILFFAMGFILLSSNLHPAFAGMADLLNDVNDPASITPAHSLMRNALKEAFEDNSVGTPCHVEYQVTKRAAGRCIKLGRDIRACAAGSYLDPFHPECM